MTKPERQAIEGCQHTLERMTEWSNQGACPICLTAALGISNDANAALESKLKACMELLEEYYAYGDAPADLIERTEDVIEQVRGK